MVARRAHNPKVVGSNPASATLKAAPFVFMDKRGCLLFCFFGGIHLINKKHSIEKQLRKPELPQLTPCISLQVFRPYFQ